MLLVLPNSLFCVWGSLLSYVRCDGVCHYCSLPASSPAGPTQADAIAGVPGDSEEEANRGAPHAKETQGTHTYIHKCAYTLYQTRHLHFLAQKISAVVVSYQKGQELLSTDKVIVKVK